MRGHVVKKGKQYYAVIYEGIDRDHWNGTQELASWWSLQARCPASRERAGQAQGRRHLPRALTDWPGT